MIASDIRSLVDTNLKQGDKPYGLKAFLQDTPIDRYVCSQRASDTVYEKDHTIQLPPSLQSLIRDPRQAPDMGLFPEIQRVWMISTTKVYLYDYVNKSSFCYDAKEKVYQVGLIQPKPGVFEDNCRWALVINSVTFITMKGIIVAEDKSMTLAGDHRVKSHGVRMKSILGSHNGRTFMLGSEDGHIYEMVYSSKADMDQLLCHTDHSLAKLLTGVIGMTGLTGFFKSQLGFTTKAITLDHQRKLIYALTDTSTIQIICLEDGASTFTYGPSLSNITEEFTSFLLAPTRDDPTKMPPASSLAILGSTLMPTPFDIVSIHPLPKQEECMFLLVTSQGCRLYFATTDSNITKNTSFVLRHVRLPPYQDQQPLAIQPSQRIQMSLQLPGSFMAITGGGSAIWATSYQERKGHKVEETSDMISSDAPVLTLNQCPIASAITSFYEHINTSIMTPHQQYIVLCKDGSISIYSKQRPVDLVLKAILSQQAEDQVIPECQEKYGSVETWALLLDIFSTNVSLRSEHPFVLDQMIHSQDQLQTAFLLVYTRIVKHIWSMPLPNLNENHQQNIPRLLDHSKGELEKVYTAFLEDYQDLGFGEKLRSIQHIFHSTAQTISLLQFLIEHRFFESDHYQQQEGILFSDLVTTTEGYQVLESWVNKAIHHFASSSLSDTVTVSKFLVEHCPTLFGGSHRLALYEGDEYLATAKHQQGEKYSALLEKSLAKYIEGMDYLQQDARIRVCNEYQSLGYYHGVVAITFKAATVPAPDTSRQHPSVGISASLLKNQPMPYTTDTNNNVVSITAVTKDSLRPLVSLLNHIQSLPDKEANQSLISVLHMTLSAAINNDHDSNNKRTVHHVVYTWLLEHDKMQVLLDQESSLALTPYLVEFLEKDETISKSLAIDWLHKYYVHLGQLDKAVDCLTSLATDIPQVHLHDRIHYLRLAIDYYTRISSIDTNLSYKNVDNATADDGPTLDRLRQWLALAEIQQDIFNVITPNNGSASDSGEMQRLASRLLPLDDLLENFARKSELWDKTLLLMHLSRSDPVTFDYNALKFVWQKLLHSTSDSQQLWSCVLDLGKHFYPSLTIFPVYLMVFMLEDRSSQLGMKEGSVVDLLQQIGVPREVLVDAYQSLLNSKNSEHLRVQLEYLQSSKSSST